jgi:PAS domain S-box-containing protein
MQLHSKLKKQVSQYLTPECLDSGPIQQLLAAVSNTYEDYDHEQARILHAFHLSKQIYFSINGRLKTEIGLKEKGLSDLKAVIRSLASEEETDGQTDDLISALALLNKHIERRNKTEAELLQNQEQLKQLSLVASLNENGVIYTDPEGTIFYANDGFSKMTGYSLPEIAGKTPIELCRGELTDTDLLRNMVAAFMEGKTFNIEVTHYRKDGSHFWGRVKGQPVLDHKGDILSYFAVVEDITDKKIADELLRKNEEKYRGILSNMNLGLVEVDREGNIQFANQSFCDLSGYSYFDLVGRNAANLFMNDAEQDLMKGKNQMRLEGISDAYEMEVNNGKGEHRWWLISGAPHFNDRGEVVGSIGVHLDITDQKRMQLELIEARQQAEESSRSKEAFLANMSHEIRTPMNAILGMGRQLKKTTLAPKQQLFLDTINTAAENLLVIINDILDISKIEAGKLIIEQIGFSMSCLLSKAARIMMHKAEEKGLQMSFSTDATVPGILLGDPHRLNQVILNLVSNAIKFTEHGSVAIRCFMNHDGAAGELIYLEVKDTGIGMDEAFQRQLFQKFQQEDISVVRKYGGTGLGMSICKQLVELMGGAIRVTSEKGKGTAVLVSIPLLHGTEADLPVKKEMASDIGILQGKKILLVEDNEMNRLVATMVLNNYGALISEVVDGWEAVKAVRQHHYDLVLMDVQMPVMDGYEATRLIRQSGYQQLPIVALTANAIKGEYEKCRKAGMNGYVSKPFEEDELIKTLAGMLGGTETMPPAERPIIAGKGLYSLEKLQQISPDDPVFLAKMLRLFLAEIPAAVQDIREAYEGHDLKKVQALAHRIKPALDNLCIQSLTNEIRELEQMAKEGNDLPRMEAIIQQLEEVIGLVAEEINNLKLNHCY